MSPLYVKLLGPAGIEGDEGVNRESVQLGAGKPLVLVARLVVEPRGLSRQALAEFLWPEIDNHKARASVRQALHVVRRALGDEALLETRDRVFVSPMLRTDWREVQEAVERRDDLSLIAAYGGAFLENVPLIDIMDVDQWIDVERARLLRLFTHGTVRETQRLMVAGDGHAAVRIAKRLRLLHPAESSSWGLLLSLLRDLGDGIALAEEYEALALRVTASAVAQPARARELLTEYAELAGAAGARAHVVLAASARTGWEETADDENEEGTVVTLFRSPTYARDRASRQVLVGHPPGARRQGDGGGLVATLLNHCGIPMPGHPRDWVWAVQQALESLRGVPHRIRLEARSTDDGMAIAAVREGARRSRGTCLHVEAVVHADVPALMRAWQDILTPAGR